MGRNTDKGLFRVLFWHGVSVWSIFLSGAEHTNKDDLGSEMV